MEDEQSSPYLPARPIVVPPLQPSAAMPMLLARHTLARSLDTLCGCSLPTVILYTSGALLATIANSPSAHRDIFIRVFDYLEWTALRALLHAGEATRHLQKREKEELYAHQSAASQRYCQLFYCRGILSLSCSVFPSLFISSSLLNICLWWNQNTTYSIVTCIGIY